MTEGRFALLIALVALIVSMVAFELALQGLPPCQAFLNLREAP